jgi:hypothetical protein
MIEISDGNAPLQQSASHPGCAPHEVGGNGAECTLRDAMLTRQHATPAR